MRKGSETALVPDPYFLSPTESDSKCNRSFVKSIEGVKKIKDKEFLPGSVGERVRELREERGLNRKELAQQCEVDESTLGRIERKEIQKIPSDAIQKLAKFFKVSTDFLLGETDIPDRKNYDIEELGLSIQAAKNLYTGAVNVQVINLLLADPGFAMVTNMIADFFDDKMAAGYAAQNQVYKSVSELMSRIAKEKPELRKQIQKINRDARAKQTPLYENELIQIQTSFMAVIRRLKKEFPSKTEQSAMLSKTVFDNMVQNLIKDGNAATILTVTSEQIAEQIKQSLMIMDGIPDEVTADLKSVLLSVFATSSVK